MPPKPWRHRSYPGPSAFCISFGIVALRGIDASHVIPREEMKQATHPYDDDCSGAGERPEAKSPVSVLTVEKKGSLPPRKAGEGKPFT